MALSTLTSTFGPSVSWTASKTITGSDYAALANTSSILKPSMAVGTAAANNAANGGDELTSSITSVSASSSASIDLTSLTDILQSSGVSLARVKAILIRLLSTTDDPTNGTAASSVTIDNTTSNSLSAQSHSGWFDNGSEGAAGGSKFTIPNGGFLMFGVGVTNAAGVLVDSTHKIIAVHNNDAGVTAKVQVTLLGGSS